jgi:cell division protein FtsB
MQEMELILTILGSFISLLLMVNAYFTRETLLRVVRLEITLQENKTKQVYIEKQVNDNTYEIKKLRDFKHKHSNDYESLVEILKGIK